MTAPRSFREAFTEDPADVKDRARLVAERDSARDWAVALEGQNAQLEAKIDSVLEVLACGQTIEPGCCSSCNGIGHSGDEATNGMCSDYRSTGHAHGPVEMDDLQAFIECVRRAALTGGEDE